jgi:hypothetical protein
MTQRRQGAFQPLIVGVDLLLRVQAAIHDDVRRKRVARQHQMLTPVVCFAPDRLAVHLRGDVDLLTCIGIVISPPRRNRAPASIYIPV